MTKPPKVKDREAVEHLYGCTVELTAGEAPDDCVHDYGAPSDCVYARRHRTKWSCPYWMLKSAYALKSEAGHE